MFMGEFSLFMCVFFGRVKWNYPEPEKIPFDEKMLIDL